MSFTESLAKIIEENRNLLIGKHTTWERVRLADVANILNGFAFESRWFGANPEKGHPLIRIRDVLRSKSDTYYEGEFDPAYLVHRGDLLIGMDGDFNSAIWWGDPGLLNQRVCKIDLHSSHFDKRFLTYCLPGYLSAINASTSSLTVKHLSSLTVADIPLPLPPLREQSRIADALDELFSDLNAGVEALERVRDKLKLYRAAVLKAAVEGALTAAWRKEHQQTEPASELLKRVLAERRRGWEEAQLRTFKEKGRESPKNWKAKYKEPVAPDITDRAPLPEGWCWTSLGQCFAIHIGATPSREKKAYWNGDIPWVASGEVQFCRIRETREQITAEGLANTSTQLNPAGSVILNMIGEGRTRGKAGILEIAACNNQNCAAIWVSETPISPHFVYFWLLFRYEQTRQLGSGNNQPAMNKSIVEEIHFPLPPLDEQEAVVESVEDQLSVIDHLESDLQTKLKNAQALRQSILRDAFAGTLVPQDPADEPASELLKRIAAEREQSAHEAAAAKKLNGHMPRRAAKPRKAARVKTTKKETENGRIADR
jgi:type I restriction enzyme S subunit